VVGEAGAVEGRLGGVGTVGDVLEGVESEFPARLLEEVGSLGRRDGGHGRGLTALTGEGDGDLRTRDWHLMDSGPGDGGGDTKAVNHPTIGVC